MRISDLTPSEIQRYFEQRLGVQFRSGSVKQVTRCPWHSDRKPSLSLDFAKGVFHCFTGCGSGGLIDFEVKFSGGVSRTQALGAIYETLGVDHDFQSTPDEEPEAIYPYTDEHGRMLFQKLRFAGKRFTQRMIAQDGGWVYNLKGVRKPLYNLPALITANQILVAEGEKDADNVNRLRLSQLDDSGFSRVIATTNFDGAGHWDAALSRYFAGKDVAILPDFDDPGAAHARAVAASVYDFASIVKVVELPGLEPHGDVSDYLQSHTGRELVDLIANAPRWEPKKSALLVSAQEFMQHISEEIDWLVEGVIQRGANGFVVADPKTGKAQPLDTPIPTPIGMRTMGDIQVGDFVYSAEGIPTEVVAVYPQEEKECFRVRMSDGTSTECAEDHLWNIQSHGQRQRKKGWRVADTASVKKILATKRYRETYIPMTTPIQLPEREFVVSPYIMGCLLGDGGITKNVTVTCGDTEIFDRIEREIPDDCEIHPSPNKNITRSIVGKKKGGTGSSILRELRRLFLMGEKSPEKFIPMEYLWASVRQRFDLVCGLLDTDGGMERTGVCFSTTSNRLAKDFSWIIQSLGGTATEGSLKKPRYKNSQGETLNGLPSHRFWVKLPRSLGCPFWIKRKSDSWVKSRHGQKRPPGRKIVSVEFSRITPVKCIRVASPSGLYLTDHAIVTHNSWLAVDLAIALATATPWLNMDVKNKVRAALITREDNPNLTKWRMRRLIQGRNLSEDDLGDRLYVNSRDQSPVFKLDVPEQLSEMMVALKQFQPEVVILDVLNVLHSGEENDNTEMRKILDHAQLMSEETKAGVCVLHHFNKDQKNGRLTQRIRGASAIAGWAEYVIGIHRQSEESEDSLRWAEFELKASSSPTKIYFRIQSDELAPRTHIDCEEAPIKSQRKSRGGNIP